jgi:hypothetical protein
MQLPSRQGEAHRVIAAARGHDATGDGMAGDREPSGPTGQGLSRISWDTSPTVGTIGLSSVLRADCLHQIHDPASRIGAVLGTNCLHQIHDPTSHIGVFNLRE